MAKQNNNRPSGRAWKMERAAVNKKNQSRVKSNKFSSNDKSKKPAPHSRQRTWVGGYTRADGTKVEGYYREIANTPQASKSSR